ncbi:MAG: hypothetical protein R3Y54_08250 [Eubacteriales bacterium]
MKKIKILTMIMTMVMTTLVGCSSPMPDLSKEDNDKVASYLASVVLDYHSASKSRLLTVSLDDLIEEEEVLEEDELEEGELEESELEEDELEEEEVVIPVITNLADILPMNGVTLMLHEYQIMSQYETRDGLGVSAKEGNQLVAVVYQMVNSTQEAREVDFFTQNMIATLAVNGNVGIRNMVTIFQGDMVMLQETLEPGEQMSGYFMFEVPSIWLTNITSLQMNVRAGGQQATITMVGMTNYIPAEGEVLVMPDLESLEEELGEYLEEGQGNSLGEGIEGDLLQEQPDIGEPALPPTPLEDGLEDREPPEDGVMAL